jgi:phosphohistidine phosphatase
VIVYLCRHGEAVDGTQLLNDESRYLTANGRREALAVGAVLREHGDAPELILTSPLVRAVQTADQLAQAVGYKGAIEVFGALEPGGHFDDVLDELMTFAPSTRVYLVGHEPQMSSWAAQFLGRPMAGRAFHRGGVARLEWPSTPTAGTATPGFYLSPSQLKPAPL